MVSAAWDRIRHLPGKEKGKEEISLRAKEKDSSHSQEDHRPKEAKDQDSSHSQEEKDHKDQEDPLFGSSGGKRLRTRKKKTPSLPRTTNSW